MSDPQLTVDEVVDRILQAVDSDGDGKHVVTSHLQYSESTFGATVDRGSILLY